MIRKESELFLRCSDVGFLLDVFVAPRASRNSILGEYQGKLKIALTSPPVDGKANEALIQFLSKLLKIPKSSLQIVKGLKSKTKSVLINSDTITLEALQKMLLKSVDDAC